ncbi:MAG: hypothetical protein AAB768_01605 [Patescibacteria group bacterium]
MLSSQNIKSFTDLRFDPAGVSALASQSGPVYILNRNRPVSILMDVALYEQMLEELQDGRDSVWLAKNENKLRKAKGKTSYEISNFLSTQS